MENGFYHIRFILIFLHLRILYEPYRYDIRLAILSMICDSIFSNKMKST